MYEIMNQGPVQALFQVYTGRTITIQCSLLGVHRQNQIPVQYSTVQFRTSSRSLQVETLQCSTEPLTTNNVCGHFYTRHVSDI